MKKISRPLVAGLSIAATCCLCACHPPHQKDSDVKVENASTFTGQAPAPATTAATAPATAHESGAAHTSAPAHH